MEHLKTFESFEYYEKVDESVAFETIKKYFKIILMSPLNLIALFALQFLPPKFSLDSLLDLIDLWNSRVRIMEILESCFNDEDISDTAKSKIEYEIHRLKKFEKKWPTVDDYKKYLKKMCFLYNVRNVNYFRTNIDKHEARLLNDYELIRKLKKTTTKEISMEPLIRNRPRNNQFDINDPYGEDRI